MLTNEEKVVVLINKLDNMEFIISSFIEHAEEFKDKYSLEDEIFACNFKKNVLLGILEDLGGTWPKPLD